MSPIQVAILGALPFLLTHTILSLRPLRTALVNRMGERAFVVAYSFVAEATFAAWIVTYATVHRTGPPNPFYASVPGIRWFAMAVVALGVAFIVSGLAPAQYLDSPALPLGGRMRKPFGTERITRHPFFTAIVLLFAPHLILAPTSTGFVFAAVWLAVILVGTINQEGKLRERWGEGYDRYLAETSAVPFAAIFAGRQRLVLGELPWPFFAAGLSGAVVLRSVHDQIFAASGIGVIAVLIVGPGVFIGVGLWRSRHG